MSKGVIIFASRTGNTKNVSEQLKTRLDGEFDLINIAENKKVDIDQYEKIVIGSYMRRRNADPDVMDFVARNKDKLLKKKLFILFLLANR
jgi:menaquinone-dependent protoporphyrinogen IX oxidase